MFLSFLGFRFVGQISIGEDCAADDGYDGEGNGGPAYVLGCVAIAVAERGGWVQQRKDSMGNQGK